MQPGIKFRRVTHSKYRVRRLVILLVAAAGLLWALVNLRSVSKRPSHGPHGRKLQPLTRIRPPYSKSLIKNAPFFERVQQCLRDSPFLPQPPPDILINPTYALPPDIEKHYREMLELTVPLRSVEWSTYAGYDGPWIENEFISRFCCDRPLSDFGGMVPLFVQWTDLWHLSKTFLESMPAQRLFSKLRKDIIYFTVSQHDEGIFHVGDVFKAKENWNILVLSAGGFGHVRLPLIAQNLPLSPPQEAPKNLFVFAGSFGMYAARREMTKILEEESRNSPGFSYQVYSGPDWVNVMNSGVFNLAPRGYGRSSFRMTEIVHMGLIPISIYDDYDWSAYHGTKADIDELGYGVRITEFRNFVRLIAAAYARDPSSLRLDEKRARVREVRDSHYSLDGVMQQIELFLKNDPSTDLSCQPHPRYSAHFEERDYPIE